MADNNCKKCIHYKESGTVGYSFCEFWDDDLKGENEACSGFQESNN